MTQIDYEANAARGAQMLDIRRPGWAEEIDTSTLRMISGYDCILGQLCGSYPEGMRVIAPRAGAYPGPSRAAWSVRHGFILPDDLDHPKAYRALTAAWTAEVNARRT